MEEKEIYGIIYMIRNNINGKIYFGLTTEEKGFKGRYQQGEWWIYSDNEHLKNSAKKYGHENFTIFERFDVAYSKEELDELEDLYICVYDTMNRKYGYNKRRGGHHGKLCQESKNKISEKVKGEKNPMYGINPKQRMDEETYEKWRKNLSESRKGEKSYMYGVPKTPEQRKKISKTRKEKGLAKGEKNPMYGKPHTNKTKEKISKTLTGEYVGEKSFRGKRVLCVTTGEIFGSCSEADSYYNLPRGRVNHVCHGRRHAYFNGEELFFKIITNEEYEKIKKEKE